MAKKCKERRLLIHLFTKRTLEGGGLGDGKRIGAIEPDGIEAKIQSLAKKAPKTAELEEQGGDLVRMTHLTVAVAEVIKHKCEVNKKVGYLDPTDWKRWSEGMQQSSLDLAEAVQAKGWRQKSKQPPLNSILIATTATAFSANDGGANLILRPSGPTKTTQLTGHRAVGMPRAGCVKA